MDHLIRTPETGRMFCQALALALALTAFACGGSPAVSSPSPQRGPEQPAAARAGSSPDAGAGQAAKPSSEQEASPPKKLTRPAEPLNVILLIVDAMRADMPWAGYPRKIAPNLTEIEKQSVSYTRAYAVSSYTAKSIGALLSGQYPSSLKRSGYFFTRYPESNLFFSELLQQANVHTMGAHAHMYMRRKNGLAQGFVAWDLVEGITFNNKYDLHVTSDKLTALAISQLEAAPPAKRRFMYLHYMDPHDIYVRHEEAPDWGKKLRDKYDQEIFFSDLWLRRFLDYCRKQPWWKKTALIVTGDHGEGFGEHHRYRHAFELYEMLVHVPMFFQVPGATPRRIDTPRSHIDLAPTILDLMEVKGDPVFEGQSLVPELFGAEPKPRPVLLDLPPDSNNDERRALIDGDYKLLVFGRDYRFELYNIIEDPAEKKNLRKAEPEKYEQMKALYQKVWGAVSKVKPYGGNKLMGGGYATGPME